MNCERFDQLLNETGGDSLPGDALRHATSCAYCAAAFAAARSLEGVLRAPGDDGASGSALPSGLSGRAVNDIMLRVARTPQVRVGRSVPLAPGPAALFGGLSPSLLAAGASATALLGLAASARFDPAVIADRMTTGVAPLEAFAEPLVHSLQQAGALSGPAVWGLAAAALSVAAAMALGGWWLGARWGAGDSQAL